MSYYILPKTNNNIDFFPIITGDEIEVYTSHTLYNYYNNIIIQLEKMCQYFFDSSFNNLTNLSKIINPCEFIFTNVPGSKFSVSKLKQKTNIFYDFLEISNNNNIFENFRNSNIKSLYVSNNYNDIIECCELLRENTNDEHIFFTSSMSFQTILENINDNRYDLIFYEVDNDNFEDLNIYIISLLEVLTIILNNQNSNGVCFIKIDKVFHKPIIDILYILSSMYEKTSIIKPNTSNVTTFEKYIVCKNFIFDESQKDVYKLYYHKIIDFLNKFKITSSANTKIKSILKIDLPYYFIIKIDDMNNIIGQQQLESISLIINILKNKNKDEKIESIKKTNIQKSINWCEKFKIPCNKFTEKNNIFLPNIKEEIHQKEEL